MGLSKALSEGAAVIADTRRFEVDAQAMRVYNFVVCMGLESELLEP
mgnify:CR=1 FL=1